VLVCYGDLVDVLQALVLFCDLEHLCAAVDLKGRLGVMEDLLRARFSRSLAFACVTLGGLLPRMRVSMDSWNCKESRIGYLCCPFCRTSILVLC